MTVQESAMAEGPPSTEHKVSFFTTCLTICSCIAGAGIITLPHGLAKAGWIGVLIICLAGATSIFTGAIGIKSLYLSRDGRRLSSYGDVGREAFGRPGLIFMDVLQKAAIFGVLAVFAILGGMLMHLTQENVRKSGYHLSLPNFITIFCAMTVLPCVFLRNPREMKGFAFIGVLTTMIVAVILIALTAQVVPLPPVERQHEVVKLSSVASGAALIGFSFGGNAVFPQIESVMQQPKRFPMAVTVATLLAILFYLPVAIAGYVVFGATVKDMFESLTNSFSQQSHPLQVGAMVASMLILLAHLFVTFPIVFSALATQIEAQIKEVAYAPVPVNIELTAEEKRGNDAVTLKVAEDRVAPKPSLLTRTVIELIRPTLWALITLMAVLVPHFLQLLIVVSAVTNTLIVMICPVVLYVVLKRRKVGALPLWEYALCFVVLVVALVLGTIATKEGVEGLHQVMHP